MNTPPYYTFSYLKSNGVRECYENFALKHLYPHVFRDELLKRYIAFISLDEFNKYYDDELNTNKVAYFHEVIFNGPQKLKFDVDIAVESVKKYKPNYKFEHDFIAHDTIRYCTVKSLNNYIKILIYNIECTLSAAFNGNPLPYKILIASASSDKKYSFHIVVDGIYMRNIDECNAFYARLNNKCLLFIDKGVNRRIQNFRILKSAKLNEPTRIFESVVPKCGSVNDFLIQNIKNCKLLMINKIEKDNSIRKIDDEISDAELEKIAHALKLIPEFAIQHRIRGCHENIINIDRIKSGMCSFCGREHTTDNNLFVCVTDSGATLYCRKYNEEHNTKFGKCILKK